jgi:hypothetical protein
MPRHSAWAAAGLAAVSLVPHLAAQTLDDVRTGARMRIEVPGPKGEQTLVGILVARTADTLQIWLDRSNKLASVPISQARQVDVSLNQHSGAGRGAVTGFVFGAIMGIVAGGGCDCGDSGAAALVFGGMLGGLGTGLGALLGMGARVDEWTPVIRSPERSGTSSETVPLGITLLQLQF